MTDILKHCESVKVVFPDPVSYGRMPVLGASVSRLLIMTSELLSASSRGTP